MTADGISSIEAGADERPIPAGSWQATFAGGILKVLLAALALGLALIDDRPLAMWVGGMLVAGGLAELLVGWTARRGIVGEVALASGAMTVFAGVFFMAAVRIGLAQLSILATVWLVLRGLASALLALRSHSSHPARALLLVRGATDLILGFALIAGLSIAQIPLLIFGDTAALTAGFLVIVAISFGVAGVGLAAIGLLERAWEQRHRTAAA